MRRFFRSRPAADRATTGPTLVEVLEQRAGRHGERQVFTFLDREKATTLTFGQLAEAADALSRALRARLRRRQRVLVMLGPGLEFPSVLFGCFRAGVVAVPAPRPERGRLARTLPRLRAILEDADPALVVTAEEVRRQVVEFGLDASPPMVTVDELLAEAESASPVADRPDPASLAFLQYTSGSTASPKGVMVTHASALAAAEMLRGAWDYREGESRALIWVPDFHDDGLVQGNLLPVYGGYRCWRMPPGELVRSPRAWLDRISRLRITHSGGPNFAYALALRRAASNLDALDLSSWRLAYNAAEPVRYRVIDEFCRVFAPAGFRAESLTPAFGLAEATLLVTSGPLGERFRTLEIDPVALETADRAVPRSGGRPVVSCGQAVTGVTVRVVDPKHLGTLEDGHIGEVVVRSACLAEGYWMRPRATDETFPRLDPDGRRFLRTGDLGFLDGGELFVTGRIKDLLILRGRNLYPQDLEAIAEAADPAIRAGCVAAVPIDSATGEEAVAILAEARPGATIATARRIFESIVEHHEVAPELVVLIRPGTLPKTSSGKMQRRRARRALESGELDEIVRFERGRSILGAASRERDADSTSELLPWLREWGRHLDLRTMDEQRALSPDVLRELAERGLFALRLGPEEGGLGLGDHDAVAVYRQLGSLDLGLTTLVLGQNALGTEILAAHGREETRGLWLRRLAEGEALSGFALSEAGSASNPRGLRSRAVRGPEGGWSLSGEKHWVGTAGWARGLLVFARATEGVTAFWVDREQPGVEVGPDIATFGVRSISQASVRLRDVSVAAEHVVGTVGQGLEIAERAFVRGRLGLAAASAGLVSRCLVLAHRFASRREIATGRLLDHAIVGDRLRDLDASITALDALCGDVVERLSDGWRSAADGAVAAKNAGARLAGEAADVLMQIYAARGYVESNEVPRLFRDARLLRIYEGTEETLAAHLGSRWQHRPDELRSWIEESPLFARLGLAGRQDSDEQNRGAESRQWLNHHVGTLVEWAMLHAATRRRATRGEDGDSAAFHRAEAWAQRHFERALFEAERQRDSGPRSPESELTASVARHATRIGELKPPPEPWPPEAPAVQDGESSASTSSFSSVAGTLVREPEESLLRFILAWLARETGEPIERLDRDSRFSAFGLDSVTAVLLADDLGRHLGRELEADLLWRYPSPTELARAVATDSS